MKSLQLLLLISLASCFSPHIPTKSELAETMSKASYDKELFDKCSKFQALAKLFNDNFDQIIKLAESRDVSFDPNAIGVYHYSFDYNSVTQNTNIKDLPNSIFQSVDSLWKQIGEENINRVEIQTNRKIMIIAKYIDMPDNTAIQHVFVCNEQSKDEDYTFNLTRDTLLHKNFIYRLGVSQNYNGW